MNNKKIAFSILIFLIVILVLGIPFTNWGFKTDDWSNLYHSIAHSFKDILNFFNLGNIEALCYPSNSPTIQQNFLKGLFRPMSFVYYLPQYLLFKTNAFGYFFTTIILHALNAVILFNILSYITPLFIAFFSSLLFAFHPTLANWLGWISAQTYQTELFVFFLSILFLKKYLDSNKFRFYLLSCLLFTSNLFLKEQTIVFPIWVIFAIFFYYKAQDKTEYKKSFLYSIGSWIISIFYLIIRAIQFPITSNCDTFNCEPNLISFLNRTKERLFDFITYVADLLFLSWMPKDHQIIKGSLILIICTILIFLFIKNSKKSFVIFLIFSVLIFSWPALLIQYQPRYIYLSIPFFILTLNILISFSIKQKMQNKYKKSISTIFALVIIFFASFLFFRLKEREVALNHITTSLKKLTKSKIVLKQIKNKKPLCFVALPPHWFGQGTAQAMWFLTNKNDFPVYEYGTSIFEKNRNSYRQIPKFNKNYLKTTITRTGIEAKSLNTEYLWFFENNKTAKSAFINIEQKYLDEKPLFIAWNYKKADFKIILKQEHCE